MRNMETKDMREDLSQTMASSEVKLQLGHFVLFAEDF